MSKKGNPIVCSCGKTPRITKVRGSMLRLRVVGCNDCKITGPARMNTADAIEMWNRGIRIGPDGNRV